MPYVNVTSSEAGSNTGSSGQLVDYLEKENIKGLQKEPELWFNQTRDDIKPADVQKSIDSNVAKLKKTEAKFFLVNISPSEKELAQIGNDPEKLKSYARSVMEEYAKNFNKGIEGKDLLYYGKVEYTRSYKYTDPEVKTGEAKRGDLKPGSQMHVQIIVSRKDSANQRLLSPLNNSSGRNAEHSKKFGQFNQVNFKTRAEEVFDKQFNYQRELPESFKYLNTMENGNISQKADMILLDRQQKMEKEQAIQKAQELELKRKQELEKQQKVQKQPEIKPAQEVKPKLGKGWGRDGGMGIGM